ncbi:MAG: serine/threonine protein kinase, partial [Jatrophihabitantaceae bacterium]
ASTGEPVALKRIALGPAVPMRTLHTEAAVLAALDHPHLVRLHELVPTGDAIVLVLDLAAGGTLAELVHARGRITPGEVITTLAPVGAAVAYAHSAGVVHGDVSPSNVLFTEAGMPLLADLGVARLLGENTPVRSTPAFIDPAVAAGCVPGPQSDVFMLGAVTLHALTGCSVWTGNTPTEVLAAAALGETADLDALLAAVDVPQAMRAVLSRALSLEPAQRGSAAEFALDLRHAGTPLVVELSAGRARSLPGSANSSASPTGRPADTGARAVPAHPAASTGPARPAFDRPRPVAPTAHPPVLTHPVRARPRPVPAPRLHRTPRGVRARWVGLGAAALALAAALSWTAFGRGRPSQGPSGASSLPGRASILGGPVAPTRAPGAAPRSRQSSPSGGPRVSLDASGVRTLLVKLDASRQRAFAERDASLLGKVYSPGPLLIQDTSLLERLVPAGCGLLGVHTAYDHVRVTAASGTRVQVVVQATLSESVLTCATAATGRAAGSGPAKLRIVLTRHGSTYLIAGIER